MLGRTCSVVRRTKLLIHRYLLPLKRAILVLQVIWMVHRTSMVHSFSDAVLVSMVWTDQQCGPTDHGTSMASFNARRYRLKLHLKSPLCKKKKRLVTLIHRICTKYIK